MQGVLSALLYSSVDSFAGPHYADTKHRLSYHHSVKPQPCYGAEYGHKLDDRVTSKEFFSGPNHMQDLMWVSMDATLLLCPHSI